MLGDETNIQKWRRTPPGVRELKHVASLRLLVVHLGRTPPGVRELKPEVVTTALTEKGVAPLPGCVN